MFINSLSETIKNTGRDQTLDRCVIRDDMRRAIRIQRTKKFQIMKNSTTIYIKKLSPKAQYKSVNILPDLRPNLANST